MKAMLTDEKKHLVWSEVPQPQPQPDEVLVKVYACAVNRADLLQRQGKYPSPPGCPPWMGLEVAGEVVSVGALAAQKSAWKPGDRVCALLGGGGYAEYVSVRYDMLMPVPQGLTLCEAASLPEVFATSYLNLFLEGHLLPGQTVYIPAGASGLASAAIPMAKAFGARVITSVLTDELAARIAPLGADIVINSTTQSVAEVFAEQEKAGTPVHVAMDCLSGASLGECLPYMARGGYWVVISTLAGVETNLQLRPLLTKGLHVVGSMLRNRTPQFKAELLEQLVKNVWPKIERKEICTQVYKILPIEQAEAAHAILEEGRHNGKVVLRVREDA